MSGSLSGTLNAGIGGPPPRPSATFNLPGGAIVSGCVFSAQASFIYTGDADGAVGGDIGVVLFTDPFNPDFFPVLGCTLTVPAPSATGQTVGSLLINGLVVEGSTTFTLTCPKNPMPGDTFTGFSISGTFRTYCLLQLGEGFAYPQTGYYAYLTGETPAGPLVISQIALPSLSGTPDAFAGITIALDAGILIYDIDIVEQDPSEIIFLDQIGTLSVGAPFVAQGTNSGTIATNMYYVLDGFAAPGNPDSGPGYGVYLQPSNFQGGSNWSAIIPAVPSGAYQIGQHTLVMADATWGVLSNVVTFTVAGSFVPSIGLNTPIATYETPVVIGGVDVEYPVATALDYQLDGGTWTINGVTSFVPAEAEDGTWSGVGPASAVGTHTLTVRNTNATSVVSNTVTYVVPPLSQTILLSIPSAQAYVAPIISGTDTETPNATSMDYMVDDSGTWVTIPMFGPAPSRGAAWGGIGPAEGPGTHTLVVRNTNATSVVSNTVTYTILGNVTTARIGLFESDVLPSSTTIYEEFGDSMTWVFTTSLLPDNQQQMENSTIHSALDLQFVGSGPVVSATFSDSSGTMLVDSQGNPVGEYSVTPLGTESTWDFAIWDTNEWDGTPQSFAPNQLWWLGPLVFKQGIFSCTGISQTGFKIGTLYMQYKVLGYTQQFPSGVT
jgi:hypothetical protein